MSAYVYRVPNDYERSLLSKLLSIDFPGVIELKQQLIVIEVRNIEEYSEGDPSLQIKVSSSTRAENVKRVPVWAKARANNDTPIEVLLHIVDGKLDELEFVRYDNQPINPLPRLEEYEILTGE